MASDERNMNELSEKMLLLHNGCCKRKALSLKRRWTLNTKIIRNFEIIFARSLQQDEIEKTSQQKGNQKIIKEKKTKTTRRSKRKTTNKNQIQMLTRSLKKLKIKKKQKNL